MPRAYYLLAFFVPLLIGYLAHLVRTSNAGPFDPRFIAGVVITVVVVGVFTRLHPISAHKPPHKQDGP